MAGQDGRTATCSFEALPHGEYLVLTTWHGHEGYANNGRYVVNGGDAVLVNQGAAPAGATCGGQIFQVLGVYEPLDGAVTVMLSSADATDAVDGTVIADAVLLLPLTGWPLSVVDLRGNALDTASQTIYLPLIEARAAADDGLVRCDPTAAAPQWTASPAPRAEGGTVHALPFVSAMVADEAGGGMLVGYSYSSEVLWFTGGEEGEAAEYVRVVASTKSAGETGSANVRAAAFSPYATANGLLYTVDSFRNMLSMVDGITGREIASQNVYSPWDVALLGTNVYVAADGRVLRYDGLLGSESYFLSLPVWTWGYLAPGPDGNLYVGQQSYTDPSASLVERVTPGGTRTAILDAAALDGMLLDLAASDDGLLYAVVGRFTPEGTYDCVVRVFDTSGTYQGVEFAVATLGADWSRVPSVEIGPDDRLYVASPGEGTVRRFNRQTGASLGVVLDHDAAAAAPGFVLFREAGRSYNVSSSASDTAFAYAWARAEMCFSSRRPRASPAWPRSRCRPTALRMCLPRRSRINSSAAWRARSRTTCTWARGPSTARSSSTPTATACAIAASLAWPTGRSTPT